VVDRSDDFQAASRPVAINTQGARSSETAAPRQPVPSVAGVPSPVAADDPFEGRQTFPTADAADLAAMQHIHRLMTAEGGVNEYGYEMKKTEDGRYQLGRLIPGDSRSVAGFQSLEPEPGVATGHQPAGHSHPNGAPLGMSGGDLDVLSRTEPLDGKRRSTILDYTTGEIHVVEMDSDATAPADIAEARASDAPLSTQNRLERISS
jgi:hypothetical protein